MGSSGLFEGAAVSDLEALRRNIYIGKRLSSEIISVIIKEASALVEQDTPSVKSLNSEGSSHQKVWKLAKGADVPLLQ